MRESVSRTWLGALGLVAALGLAHCGSFPELTNQTQIVDLPDATAGSSSSSGGSDQNINTDTPDASGGSSG
ncbi:MAG TPA: hypothetical protein VHV51_10700, partial [Polyangiaceae bacterium]|nr:hypothetical protein [Polyangiaceae bacterium]